MKCTSKLNIFDYEGTLVSKEDLVGILIGDNENDSAGCINTTKSVLPGIDINNNEVKEFFGKAIKDKRNVEGAINEYIEVLLRQFEEYDL